MNQDKRVDTTGGDHPGTDHRLAEGRGGGEYAVVVLLDCRDGSGLDVVQRAEELHFETLTRVPLVLQLHFGTRRSEQLGHFIKAAARQADMAHVQFGARDNARFAVGCQPQACAR